MNKSFVASLSLISVLGSTLASAQTGFLGKSEEENKKKMEALEKQIEVSFSDMLPAIDDRWIKSSGREAKKYIKGRLVEPYKNLGPDSDIPEKPVPFNIYDFIKEMDVYAHDYDKGRIFGIGRTFSTDHANKYFEKYYDPYILSAGKSKPSQPIPRLHEVYEEIDDLVKIKILPKLVRKYGESKLIDRKLGIGNVEVLEKGIKEGLKEVNKKLLNEGHIDSIEDIQNQDIDVDDLATFLENKVEEYNKEHTWFSRDKAGAYDEFIKEYFWKVYTPEFFVIKNQESNGDLDLREYKANQKSGKLEIELEKNFPYGGDHVPVKKDFCNGLIVCHKKLAEKSAESKKNVELDMKDVVDEFDVNDFITYHAKRVNDYNKDKSYYSLQKRSPTEYVPEYFNDYVNEIFLPKLEEKLRRKQEEASALNDAGIFSTVKNEDTAVDSDSTVTTPVVTIAPAADASQNSSSVGQGKNINDGKTSYFPSSSSNDEIIKKEDDIKLKADKNISKPEERYFGVKNEEESSIGSAIARSASTIAGGVAGCYIVEKGIPNISGLKQKVKDVFSKRKNTAANKDKKEDRKRYEGSSSDKILLEEVPDDSDKTNVKSKSKGISI